MIPILPTIPTDIARLNLRIKTLREKGLTHALKKAPGSKKRKKGADKDTNGVVCENGDSKLSDEEKKKPSTNGAINGEPKQNKKEKLPASLPATNGTSNNNSIKNASTASLTQKVMQEQEERNKRRKLAENENVKSLFSKSDARPDVKRSADYMTRGFSIGRK